MSTGDWWLNHIGTAATVTAPSGSSVPQYGVSYDLGTAPWPDAASFNNFAADTVARTRGTQIAAAQQQQQATDEGWFQKRLAAAGTTFKQVVGANDLTAVPIVGAWAHGLGFGDDNPDEQLKRGEKRLNAFTSAPVAKQIFEGFDTALQGLSTPFVLDRYTTQKKDLGLWFDKSAWGAAWREADDRTLGQAVVDDVLSSTFGTSSADLDRMRRTNSLYGMTTFALDLVAGAKLDPSVLGAKGIGEIRNVKAGILPAETSRLKPEALRAARGEARTGNGPMARYASYRGRRVATNFGDLRDFAQTHSLSDMTGLPMFKRLAVNGPQAALAFKIAAGDDKLWDLTQRAVLADPAAWREIGDLKHGVPENLRDYAPADTRTYLDAIDATKTKMSQLETEVNDLEKQVSLREAQQPLRDDSGKLNPGFFNYHTWELTRDLADKQADIEEMARRLEGHDDYGTWLAQMPHVYGDQDWYAGPVTSVDQVSVKRPPLDFLAQHTYQKSSYGATHQVTQIAKAGWMMKANPIDLNRVDSGVQSIRRQFEQYDHLMGYKDPEGLDNAITSFVKAPDQYERFKVAKQIEDTHLVNAISQKFGLEPETVDAFLSGTRLRKNEMMNALLSGDGAVYSTGSLMDTAKLIKRDNGMAEIEVMDNGKRVTMRVPEEALSSSNLPVDPTQTPNMYTPMDTREVYLAVKRNNELFEALDEDVRNFGAKQTAKVMESINSMGSAWNQLWKPIQLFRLAWPQRVIMDEGLRALAVLGVNQWARNFGAAMRDASLNAVNPLEHGILPYLDRRRFKLGPGPITDGISGRDIDVPEHDAVVEDAPFVPSYYTPQLNKERQAKLGLQVAKNNAIQRTMDRTAAMLRDPNSTQSLQAGYTDLYGMPHDWVKLDEAVLPEEGILRDLVKAVDQNGRGPHNLGTKSLLEYDLEDADLPWIMQSEAATAGEFDSARVNKMIQEYGIGGTRRTELEAAIEHGKRLFDEEVARRKTGAGHGPLFPYTFSTFASHTAQRDLLLAKELGAKYAPGNYRSFIDHPGAGRLTTLRRTLPEAFHDSPASQAFRRFDDDRRTGPIRGEVHHTFDAITGKQVHSGYAVPIAEAEVGRAGADLRPRADQERERISDLHAFIEQHQELLASNGYRITASYDRKAGAHTVQLVRVFRSNELRKATDFGDHVGADHFVNIGDGHKRYIRQWADQSPIMEELNRRFVNTPEQEFNPGEAPIAGKPAVFHGTATGLPENLAPRTQVPAARGNYAGQGFYTTVSKKLAETYNNGHGLYTIRGSKDGRTYKTFNLEDEMTPADKAELSDYILNYYHTVSGGEYYIPDQIDYAVNEINQAEKWLHAVSDMEGMYVSGNVLSPQQLVTKFLHEERGAGALMYDGGRLSGGTRHQVYVWLEPENLNVRPAYQPTGRYYSLEEWFQHPDSVEELIPDPSGLDESVMHDVGRQVNEVPENRIMRVGPKPRAQARQVEEPDVATGELPAEAEVPDQQINSQIDSVHNRFVRRLLRKRQFGRGYTSWKSHDGKRVVAANALEGPGEVYLPLISSNPVYSRLTDTYKRTLSKYREKAVGYKSTPPPDVSPEALRTTSGRQAAVDYYTSWADLLNDQIRNSPIWYRMLDGQTDDEIVHWLTSTDEGAQLRRSFPHLGHRPEKWVEEHRQRLNSYVPDENLQRTLLNRQLTAQELRSVPSHLMPTIYEPDLQMVSGRGEYAQFIADHVDRIYHALGTVPSDQLVRQPFFKALYDLKMRNLVKAADSEYLTNGVLRGYEKLAREFALRQVKRHTFDLADETNFTQALRFLAPFWGAQQEAMTKWFNIAIEKPETVAKFYVGVNATYNHFQVIDEDGKPTKGPGNLLHYNPNDRVILQIPKALTKIAPFDKMLKEFGSVGVAFGAANTALQGDNPMIPSLGPIVTVPADKLINAMWDTHGTQFDNNFFYRWLFPVGRPAKGIQGTMEQMFPGWGRRLSALQQGQDSRSYANTYWSVYRELDLDHRKRGLPPPTPEEVDKATKWHFGLRVLASFALPAAMEFRPKHQMFLDEYHKMQELYGPDAFEHFVKKFGADAARYASSSSNSPVGIPPTAQAMEEWSQNKSLIQKYPDWGGAIVSPGAWADDFSSDAYGAQFDIKVGPGTKETLREQTDPAERAKQTDVRLGWLQYRQFMSSINAELYNRGLTSLDQKEAADLKAMKASWVSDMEKKLPAWSDDYRTFEDTIYSKVGELQSFAFDKQFDSRPDIQGARQYLLLRQAAAHSLDVNAAGGGSRNLQAQENTELRNWFYGQVGSLIQQNPAFGEFYTRYLESDRLERGSGP